MGHFDLVVESTVPSKSHGLSLNPQDEADFEELDVSGSVGGESESLAELFASVVCHAGGVQVDHEDQEGQGSQDDREGSSGEIFDGGVLGGGARKRGRGGVRGKAMIKKRRRASGEEAEVGVQVEETSRAKRRRMRGRVMAVDVDDGDSGVDVVGGGLASARSSDSDVF